MSSSVGVGFRLRSPSQDAWASGKAKLYDQPLPCKNNFYLASFCSFSSDLTIKIILRKNTLLTKKRFRLSGIKNPTLPLNRRRKDVRAAFSLLLRGKSTDYSPAPAKIIFIFNLSVFP